MKILFKNIVWFVLFGLIFCNIYIFVSGMSLSEELNHYEKEIKILHQKNSELDRKLSETSSLKYAASMSAMLKIDKKSQPFYIENLKYALNR